MGGPNWLHPAVFSSLLPRDEESASLLTNVLKITKFRLDLLFITVSMIHTLGELILTYLFSHFTFVSMII